MMFHSLGEESMMWVWCELNTVTFGILIKFVQSNMVSKVKPNNDLQKGLC